MSKYKLPINLYKWIEENREKLEPPVGNYMIFDQGEFKVMIVGGPNERSDFHIEEGEEFFFQIKGDMILRIHDTDNQFKDISIKEGEMFVLPAKIPHSPQRPKDTIGLVIERERKKDELDALRWYCEKCKEILYEEWFHCVDLGVQLKPIIEKYNKSDKKCKKCGHQN